MVMAGYFIGVSMCMAALVWYEVRTWAASSILDELEALLIGDEDLEGAFLTGRRCWRPSAVPG